MIPKAIGQGHILKAIKEIDTKHIPKKRESGKFVLLYNGKQYPPKYLVSVACRYATGTELDSSKFGGGQETNRFLKDLGFEVVEIVSLKRDKKQKRKHNERCPKCKITIKEMLKKIYGEVKENYRFETGTKPEDYKNTRSYSDLERIFSQLQKYRNHRDFVKASNLAPCDFFIPKPGFIVEFDESQHFSACRKLSLTKYPASLELGFNLEKWIELCQKLDKRDPKPPYRDEQRAWYDTLRDFLPTVEKLKPTIRLFSRDYTWCDLDPTVPSDVRRFKLLLEGEKQEWTIEVRKDSNPSLARIILARDWSGNISVSRELLEEIYYEWPRGQKVNFLVTCGGFITLNWPSSLLSSDVGPVRNPNRKAIELLMEKAEEEVNLLLSDSLRRKLRRFSRYMTIGVDFTRIRNRSYNLEAELVVLIDLQSGQYHWTGKSYPVRKQEKRLVIIDDLQTHFSNSQFGKVMILGCHDLTIFNPRSDATAKNWRKGIKSTFKDLSIAENPRIVLQHPHNTVSTKSWTTSWKKLIDWLPEVEEYISAGSYFKDGDHRYSKLSDVLAKTKRGNTIDFIVWPKEMN